eukprot:TRINITY_DN18959_c0_g1::TRINITY_DN18959_c0_g1_i1::g.21714::m.21714 TRINITY_DN18959_c0_g1::TRINITY_DN18959_c0_g1_i1::g.21714  ORF type:complete len:529 (+),score=65.76,sp/Q8VD72/TTC8_MOUSE/54.63/0.0,TPR_11/PF13414.1/72,TPR_11/PF13414.1/0.12,TPR_11/PF13414.1/0.00022,TPR_11/PF13414.1/0.012,TPR_11/PF13414.1/3.2e-07,TPR_11/PF13414.1/1.5e-09,TPR_11/PF13414.1/5e-05,TPR_11/PF13414.1/7.4,TPR_2/PF07719.12/1.4e+02,TPR_2/PF07719.12/5.4e+02,TPR_2/PF07719.12/4.4,TPR_2/PF07719.12/0.56,TPR_2/PF07719.12/0.87,TPR_
MTEQVWIDDTEMEEEGIAEVLLDDNATAQAPRPGTSLQRPLTSSQGTGSSQGVRPMTGSGRPLTGFARPGTSSRPGTGKSVESAFQGSRPGTTRPVSSGGRFVRLGTASMLSEGGMFINVNKLDLRKYATRPPLAKALCDYILYHEHNPKKALELAAHATVHHDYKDWWWKARLGKCYYQLSLLRDAEKQFKSALNQQEMVTTYLELAKVYLKLDQPKTALDIYEKASNSIQGDVNLILAQARVYDALGDLTKGVDLYRRALHLESSNVEAIACLAAHHFYSDQPEIALRFYRRLLQMGVNSSELWNNLGLCCFYASQYDLTLSCFERALALATDDNLADVWYNIGQVGLGIGDTGLAYQAFKIAVAIDNNHAESFNNLGVLEVRKSNNPNVEAARSNFHQASKLADHMFEPLFNSALLSFKVGDFQESYEQATKSLNVFPEHCDTQELLKQLRQHFTML